MSYIKLFKKFHTALILTVIFIQKSNRRVYYIGFNVSKVGKKIREIVDAFKAIASVSKI